MKTAQLAMQDIDCPDCDRILFATRDSRFPHHFTAGTGREWCGRSGEPVTATHLHDWRRYAE